MESSVFSGHSRRAPLVLPTKPTDRRRACFGAIATLLLLMSTSLRAALMGYEGFAYPLNASLPGQNGGTGFSGPWVAGVNAGVPASRFQMFTPSLSYPGLASDGVRLRVTSGAAQGARHRVRGDPCPSQWEQMAPCAT